MYIEIRIDIESVIKPVVRAVVQGAGGEGFELVRAIDDNIVDIIAVCTLVAKATASTPCRVCGCCDVKADSLHIIMFFFFRFSLKRSRQRCNLQCTTPCDLSG